MAFSEETKRKAFERAGGRCEKCGKQLVFKNRGANGGRGKWEAHHSKPRASGGTDTLQNCVILCYDCHQKPAKAVSRKSSSSKSSSDVILDLIWGTRR